LSSGALGGEGEQTVPAYVQALLEQTAESLENLQVIITRGEEGRYAVNEGLVQLTGKVETLTDHMRTEQAIMKNLAQLQMDMRPVLEKLSHSGSDFGDDASRQHLRNMDTNMQRLVEETTRGRDEIVDALKREVRLLARTIAAAGGDGRD